MITKLNASKAGASIVDGSNSNDPKRNMISILILTLNEVDNLPGCMKSVAWSDDIHVMDSYSTDGTVELARELGAQVHFRKFDSFSQQQNWALENIPFKYPWVFYFDADERVTPALQKAMLAAVANPGENVAFSVLRRDFLRDTWLKHVQMTAFYQRLFRPEKMRYERLGHCVSKADGPVATIEGYLDHFPFSKGWADWVKRHNFYSDQEAQQIVLNRKAAKPVRWGALISPRTRTERKETVKEVYYRLPGRPVVKFLTMYVVKRGFLDGMAGFYYSAMIGFYELMIVLKTDELNRPAERGPGA